jgi:mRNA-degrading endonuclease RelE of RelBE toxin-antitoxin system
MPFTIDITDLAYDELSAIKVYHRRQIIDAIHQQLECEPTVETRNRKVLAGTRPTFEHRVPVWELRVGAYRVYYDVSEESMSVLVRSVRLKPPHSTTEQVV